MRLGAKPELEDRVGVGIRARGKGRSGDRGEVWVKRLETGRGKSAQGKCDGRRNRRSKGDQVVM